MAQYVWHYCHILRVFNVYRLPLQAEKTTLERDALNEMVRTQKILQKTQKKS